MNAIDRAVLLQKAEELVGQRDFYRLENLLDEHVTHDSWFRFYLALAHSHNGKDQLALQEIQSLSEDLKDESDRLYIRVLNLEGVMLMEAGHHEAAYASFARVLALSTQRSDLRFVASASLNLGTVAAVRHQWSQALVALQRAMAVSAFTGNRHYVAGCHHNLGMIFRDTRRFSSAATHFQSAARLYRICGTEAERLATECEEALMVGMSGDPRAGFARASRAKSAANIAGLRRLEGEAARVRGVIAAHRKDYRQSIADLRLARLIGREVENPLLVAEASELLGKILWHVSGSRRGERLLQEARQRFERLKLPGGKADLWLPLELNTGLSRAS